MRRAWRPLSIDVRKIRDVDGKVERRGGDWVADNVLEYDVRGER